MDIRAHSEVSSSELARELLISISYSLPDKILNSPTAENIVKVEDGTVFPELDETDNEYRSKLISLSYNQSPDAGVKMCNGCP
ncbi:hypothetical protein LguiB_034368 [Lonicera macranthoides]